MLKSLRRLKGETAASDQPPPPAAEPEPEPDEPRRWLTQEQLYRLIGIIIAIAAALLLGTDISAVFNLLFK